MARILLSNDPENRGDCIYAVADGAPLGRLDDKRKYRAEFGSAVGWRDEFVVLECPGISLTEARTWCQPVEQFRNRLDKGTGLIEKEVLNVVTHAKRVEFETLVDTKGTARQKAVFAVDRTYTATATDVRERLRDNGS